MSEAEAPSVPMVMQDEPADLKLRSQLIKCDMCGDRWPAEHFERLVDICPERLWCRKCRLEMAEAERVSKLINDASDEVTAAIQKYIRALASNVDLKNPHHERLLRRMVNFYQKAKLVFARDTDEGQRKARLGATVGNSYGLQGLLTGATSAIVDTNADMEMWGNDDDPELDGIPRQQGINGQETMGSRLTRELMAIVPSFSGLLQRQVAAQEEANRLRAAELERFKVPAVPPAPAPPTKESLAELMVWAGRATEGEETAK